MLFFLTLLGLPIAYLVVIAKLLIRRDSKGVAESVVFCGLGIITVVWAISQSRSSTAGIGFLGLPMMGALSGFLGLAFGRYRNSAESGRKIGAWGALACGLLLVSYTVVQGEQTKSKNRRQDDQWEAQRAEIARDRELIDATLKHHPEQKHAWLDSSIRTRMNDRSFLLAALPNDSISPEILDSLANSPDMGIALEAVRNPGTNAATLERVYRTKAYPDYFFQALAAHRHTPPSVLLDLYRRPRTITTLDIWFAGNPATPKEILLEIAGANKDRSVIGALLENPSLDCGILSKLAVNLMKTQNRDADNPNVMRLNELLPKVCRNTTP
ncbi:MAG: hypothetical protein M3Z18_09890 [Gemmatimonadota bacterium]|nr:hypothetical protein [Gemmatimonadota bacterium]